MSWVKGKDFDNIKMQGTTIKKTDCFLWSRDDLNA